MRARIAPPNLARTYPQPQYMRTTATHLMIMATLGLAPCVQAQTCWVTNAQPAGCNNSGSCTVNGTFTGSTWTLSVFNGAFSLIWSQQYTSGATAQHDLTGLAPDGYTVFLDTQGGLGDQTGFGIQSGPAITLAETHTDPIGTGGSINLTVSGGTPPFSYAWSNGSTGEDLSGLAPGLYSVTVTDSKACSATLSVSLVDATSVADITAGEMGIAVLPGSGSYGPVTIQTDLATSGTLEFTIVDLAGRSILNPMKMTVPAGRNTMPLPGSTLGAGGCYVLLISNGNDVVARQRFVRD